MELKKVNNYLEKHSLPPIKFEILEAQPASGEHPIGGRLWTHRICSCAKTSCNCAQSPNDYYDRGAMRFPDNPDMKPLFDLFKELQLPIIDYVFTTNDNVNLFNSRVLTNAEVALKAQAGCYDAYQTAVEGLTGTVGDMVYKQIGGFREELAKDREKGWAKLLEYDAWSTRGFMTLLGSLEAGRYSTEVVDYLETFSTGSTMYNQALVETVLDSMAFDYPVGEGEEEIKWYTIQGGVSAIAEAMAEQITGTIANGKRVTALAPVLTKRVDPNGQAIEMGDAVDVTIHGESEPRRYSHVISTVPFGSFRLIDTSACCLSWNLQSAIRSLGYDASTKVGIKFKYRWWEQSCEDSAQSSCFPKRTSKPQLGGTSYTDRPTRVVTYPSYGIGSKDATIIVSYTWSQDALRLGAYQGDNEDKKEVLLNAIINDLAAIHGIENPAELRSLVVGCDIWSWYQDENAVGAFALFGPQQFSKLYCEVTQPAAYGRLHFAGEATSVYHAWVLGALASANRVLQEMRVQEPTHFVRSHSTSQFILDLLSAGRSRGS
ncbi:hypothetical protein BXZ70DRAFT_896012 [Cristinia sonorae]|uniref:Amine oxidase domain-containing protein n=1 Tax=Cristinia sonorae TaxID=1940300 RepID=A0A8K0XND9_9AGAR|nr:hypothetical protein BXZ70DRAFT_896012 [Cristinia sonorae]